MQGLAGLPTLADSGLDNDSVMRLVTVRDLIAGQSWFDTTQYRMGLAGGFEAGGRHTTSLLVDGDYPPVRRLFPEETPIHAVVELAPLTEAARRVALVAERNTPIRLAFSEGQVVLDAGQGDDAQASEALEATLVGEEITVAFNPQYLLDGLGALTTPYVRFSFTHPNKPVEFTGQETVDADDDKTYRYLLVPIRFAS